MILRQLTPDHPDIPALKKLYEEAFPANERPLGMDTILAFLDQMPCDLLGIYPEETPDEFAGFFFGVKGESGVYGVYFATRPELRSYGIGGKAFRSIVEHYGDLPFWFSYESVFEESDNAEQRERRRGFYLRNGFHETGWFTKLNGTEFIIACSKEEFDKEAFEKFMASMAAGIPDPQALPKLYRHDYDKLLAVKCNNGTFVGKETDGQIIWKGIPYATQPVGQLRWKKALPAADDDGVYDATKPGHVPIGPVNDSNGTAEFGEDCLVLNIYCNTRCTDGKKPVMVWIHGGGFCAESQASPLYDLTNISKQYPDILFVSIDYRLGFMGFMNFERVPGGENFKEAGNLGLLDQLEALRWVQKNIAGFGGDPDNVTIFGESAGSASVTFLPLIEGSEGLFRRGIAQSANIAYTDTMEHGIHVTQNFLTATGCQTMDELMALTTEQLVEAYAIAAAIDKNCLLGTANFPLLDGVTLPEDRADLYEMWGDEKRAKIDLMIGSNLDEIRYFVPFEGGEEGFLNTLRWIAKRDRALLNDQEKTMFDEFMATFAGESEGKRLEQYCNDINFRAGNTDMAIRHAAGGGNTYMYFVRKPVITPELGVTHAAEIPYLFDNCIPDPMGSGAICGNDECEFRHVVKEMWTNFARTGNPSTDQYEWKKFSGDDRQTMVFDDAIGMQKDIFGRREDLMMSWAERLGNGSSKRVC